MRDARAPRARGWSHGEASLISLMLAGATSNDPVRVHRMPWGPHRQGGLVDPFGHRWLVGDRSPLRPHP